MSGKRKKYSKDEVVQIFLDGIKHKRPYMLECVKWNGPRSKKQTPYIEIISSLILEDETRGIVPYVDNVKHNFKYDDKRDLIKPRVSEKRLCRQWYFNADFGSQEITEKIGIPAEYELNIVEENGGHTNVDLVSYKDGTIHLLEVKGCGRVYYNTSESLLRAVLEIKTYFESLKNSLKEIASTCRDNNKTGIQNAYSIKMAILVPKGSNAAKQYNNPRFPNLNKLIERWGIEVLIFDNKVQ